MGMVTCLAILSDANIARVLADPPLIWQVVAPDDPDLYDAERGVTQRRSLLDRLLGRSRPGGTAVAPVALSDVEGEAGDLDKAWHGIHFLLTGTGDDAIPPLNFLVAGGQVVGAIEVGYGPARVFTADEVRRIADALAPMDDAALRGRFEPARMTREKVYPDIWDRGDETEENLAYLLEYMTVLRDVVERAVASRHGLVVYVT